VQGWRLVGNIDYRLVGPAECAGCDDKAACLKADLFSLCETVLKVVRFEPAVCIKKTNPVISFSDCHQTADATWRIAMVPVGAIQAHMPDIRLIEPALREAVRNDDVVRAYGLLLYRRCAAFKTVSRLLVIGCYEGISRILFPWRLWHVLSPGMFLVLIVFLQAGIRVFCKQSPLKANIREALYGIRLRDYAVRKGSGPHEHFPSFPSSG
jgi:hypothetical protein